jgi:NADPH-dependent glutamate synthase beta subunit-like oxidoreductase
LLAAYDLRVKGHAVVVFESEAEPGGMLRWAIPEFRLPLAVLQAELDLLSRMGIAFECGVSIGPDRTLEELKGDFDAVIVATGCPRWAELDMPGEDLPGVLHGLPFLHNTRGGRAPSVGKRVVVIGGGNVAVDAAQTALRLGAEDVTIACLESEEEIPAFPWAVDTALFEKIQFAYGWGPVRFLSDGGSVSAVELQRCVRVYDENSAFDPRFASEDRRTLPADTVIVAIGQARDTSLFAGTGLLRDGRLHADPLTLQMGDEKVFLAGDLLSGPSSAVEAMAQGREAAESVHRLLNGEHLRYGREYAGPVITEFEIEIEPGLARERAPLPLRRYGGVGDFLEIEGGLDPETARHEAQRCNSCAQPVGFYRTCWFCLPCEVECPEEALYVEVPYLLR